MNTHDRIAMEAIGFAPRTYTPAEWAVEAARIRRIEAARKARKRKAEEARKGA